MALEKFRRLRQRILDRRRFGRPSSERAPASIWVDGVILLSLLALVGGLIALGREWAAPVSGLQPIDLSARSLPVYTFYTFSRGAVAYFFSLAFTIVFGTLAARYRRVEKIVIPTLDVLQGIPVLSFLPVLTIGLVGLFPRSNLGPELVCVLAIFTGQVWNMVFSYHNSLRSIPKELLEVARVCRLGPWGRIVRVEMPSAAIGLIWNSMVSMAGGWFFISIVESFKIGGQDYRLPGLGSYMKLANDDGDRTAMVFGCLAMTVLIVLVDQLVWRPLIAWSQRFKVEETADPYPPRSFVYNFLRRSTLGGVLRRATDRLRSRWSMTAPAPEASTPTPASLRAAKILRWSWMALGTALALCAVLLLMRGGQHLLSLLLRVKGEEWIEIFISFGVTALRVLSALFIGVAWTLPLGLWIGRSPRAAAVLIPVLQTVASFPFPILFSAIALALLAAGLNFGWIAVILMLVGTQWYILFNVVAGAAAIPGDLVETARVFGLGRWQRLRLLELPAIFPSLLIGLITAAGGAWNASIVSEWVEDGKGGVLSARGIGALIARAFKLANDDQVSLEVRESHDPLLAGSVLVLAVALVLINRFFWKRLYRYADRKYSLNR